MVLVLTEVTVEGKRHLEAALGSHSFTDCYVSEKVELWLHLVDRLSGIGRIHPHAAYAAFTHGLCNKWTYLIFCVLSLGFLSC